MDRSETKVLIIEDEMVTAEALRETLQKEGYTVVGIAANVTDALLLARVESPTIALVDIVLHGERDGIAAARLLRAEFDLAIVFVTSLADDLTLSRTAAVKPNGYLVKPFRAVDVHSSVRSALANQFPTSAQGSVSDQSASSLRVNGGLSPANLNRVIQHIARNFNTNLRLGQLADMCGLSEHHFSSQFGKSVGMPPLQYIINERVNEAKHLLDTTHWSVSEVAKAVGYDNPDYFSVVFRRVTGVSPSRYR